MARSVYSLRIFAHAGLTSAGGIVGPTVPADLIYIVRDIDVYESTGVTGTTVFVLNALGGALWSATRSTTPGVGPWSWRGRQVYSPGEQVGFEVISGTWAIAVSGYQLTLP